MSCMSSLTLFVIYNDQLFSLEAYGLLCSYPFYNFRLLLILLHSWAMGNLGRAGYGASLEGMWPYTYDACDVGTLPNQTLNGLPTAYACVFAT